MSSYPLLVPSILITGPLSLLSSKTSFVNLVGTADDFAKFTIHAFNNNPPLIGGVFNAFKESTTVLPPVLSVLISEVFPIAVLILFKSEIIVLFSAP